MAGLGGRVGECGRRGDGLIPATRPRFRAPRRPKPGAGRGYPDRRMLIRVVLIVMAATLGVAACTGSDTPVADQATVPVSTSSSTSIPSPVPTPTAVPSTTSTTAARPTGPLVVELQPDDVMVDLTIVDPELSYVDLAPEDEARLTARFEADPEVLPLLLGVKARGIRRGDTLVAVVVSVAVTPASASDPEFIDSFMTGATEGATVSPLAVEVAGEELTSYIVGTTGSLLWHYENLFVVYAGRDLSETRKVAEAMVTAVVAPPPPPTTTTTTTAEG